MKIGLVGQNWWARACRAVNVDVLTLPQAGCADGGTADSQSADSAAAGKQDDNPYAADVAGRIEAGGSWRATLAEQGTDFLLDNGGAGLAFVKGAEGTPLTLLHEASAVPLASHFIDPIVTAFQSLPWGLVWQCLQSRGWHKFVWDKPQTDELRRFGVCNVHYLPMAAPDRPYDTRRLDPDGLKRAVSFVGSQNTSFFAPNHQVQANTLLAGTLAQAVLRDMADLTFYSVYFDLYGLTPAPSASDDMATSTEKAFHYFSNKLFYNAANCIRQRDRFVLFLKKKLKDAFSVVGTRWDGAYGVACLPKLETADAYFEHFRESAINLNLVNGNSDSGLNMRHFEITAAGGFMLCYHCPEIGDFFEVGRECDTFRNEQELLEKIDFYLEHADRRREIALAGQRRTLENHLFSHRLGEIVATLAEDESKPVGGQLPAEGAEATAGASAGAGAGAA